MKLKSYLRGLGTGLFISAVLMGISVSGKPEELSDAEIRTRAKALGMVEEDSVLVKPAKEAAEVIKEPGAETEEEQKEEQKEEPKEESKAEVSPKEGTEAGTEDASGTKPEEAGGENEQVTERKDTEVAVLSEDNEPAAEEATEAGEDIRDSKEDRAMGGQNENESSQEKVTGLQNSSDKLGYNEFFTVQIASGSSSETVSRLLKRGGAIDDADDFDEYLCNNHYDKKITPGVFKIPVGADYQQIADIITGGS